MNQKLVLNRIDKSNVTKLNHPTFNKLASQFIILLCLFALTSSFMYIQFLIHGSKFDVSVASSGKNINEFKFDTKTVGNQSSFKKYSSINVVNIRNFTNILSNKTRQSVIVNIALQSEVKSNITCDNDESCITWRQKLLPKIDCIKTHCGLYFYYHMRKAAGTTITQVLQLNSIRLKTVKFLPAEGLPLDHRFLNQNGIITHVSFRNPVDRIISLYWYEHVLYYHKVQKKPGKASTLRAWVNHWSDSNPWKQNFTRINPSTIYIDIENYYIKALTNWDGIKEVTRTDLEIAKRVVDQFDIVIVSEMFNLKAQHALLELSTVAVGFDPGIVNFKILSTDKSVIQMYQSSLAADEVEIREILRQRNQLDIELHEYAKQVMTRQVDALTPILRSFSVQNSKHGSANARTRNYTTTAYNIDLISFQEKKRSNVFSKPLLDSYLDIRMCSSKPQCSPNISEHMYNVSGVVRPLYHKAPVNTSYVEPPSYPPVNKPTGIPQNAAVLPPNIEHPDRNELDARLEALLLRYKHELKSASKIP